MLPEARSDTVTYMLALGSLHQLGYWPKSQPAYLHGKEKTGTESREEKCFLTGNLQLKPKMSIVPSWFRVSFHESLLVKGKSPPWAALAMPVVTSRLYTANASLFPCWLKRVQKHLVFTQFSRCISHHCINTSIYNNKLIISLSELVPCEESSSGNGDIPTALWLSG